MREGVKQERIVARSEGLRLTGPRLQCALGGSWGETCDNHSDKEKKAEHESSLELRIGRSQVKEESIRQANKV